MGWKGVKMNYCWVLSTNLWIQKACWQCPAMFCLYAPGKLSLPWFEFSLDVKLIGMNPGYLLKSSLPEMNILDIDSVRHHNSISSIFSKVILFKWKRTPQLGAYYWLLTLCRWRNKIETILKFWCNIHFRIHRGLVHPFPVQARALPYPVPNPYHPILIPLKTIPMGLIMSSPWFITFWPSTEL